MKRNRAFTLIELLIVVAIIAILAAIAVPNFLEAQTRSKVSRAIADMRSLATALEAYAVDNQKYVFDLDSRGWPWYMTDPITTPIAYMTSGSTIEDLFRVGSSEVARFGDATIRYRYINYEANRGTGWKPSPFPGPFFNRWVGPISDTVIQDALEEYGAWKISSAGPDQRANTTTTSGADFFFGELLYDPTNGTISNGDIVRSQKTMSGQ